MRATRALRNAFVISDHWYPSWLTRSAWIVLIWKRPQFPPPGLTASGSRFDSQVATESALSYWSGKYSWIAAFEMSSVLQADSPTRRAMPAMAMMRMCFTGEGGSLSGASARDGDQPGMNPVTDPASVEYAHHRDVVNGTAPSWRMPEKI